MDDRSKKGKEIKTVTRQILSRLEVLENRIEAIELSLKNIDRSSFLTGEDQLFFGFVCSLLLFSLTLPELNIGTLFEGFGVKIEASEQIITTNVALIVFLMLAGSIRYLTVFADDDVRRNRRRTISVGFLLSSLYLLISDFLIRGLGTFLADIYVFLIFLAPAALVCVAVGIAVFVERKWYHLYGYDEPYISLIFGYLGLSITVVYLLSVAVSLFLPISDVVAILLLLASVPITILIIRCSYKIYKRLRPRSG